MPATTARKHGLLTIFGAKNFAGSEAFLHNETTGDQGKRAENTGNRRMFEPMPLGTQVATLHANGRNVNVSSIGLSYDSMKAKPKVALIGCRNVAPASAYSLLNGPAAIEAVLIGENAQPLLKSVSEIINEWPVRTDSTIRVGEAAELKDAEICILSSGDPPVEGDTEDSFLSRNVDIVRQKGDLLRDSGFRGVLIVTTHPAEIMAQVAMEASGLGSESVIGIGPNSVSNLALTTDRRLPVATWCSAAGCDVEHVDSCHPDCPYFEDMLERFHSYQRSADRGRPASMANCVTRICEAIFNDEKAVLPVAALLKGEHAIMGTFSSVPCVIGKRGIEKVLELPLSDVERKDLLDTAQETGRLFYRLTKRALAVSNGNRA